MNITSDTAAGAWDDLLDRLYHSGKFVSPRGHTCRELCGVAITITDARNNLIVNSVRNLQYRFAVAEWLWIWYGRDDVETIARYNKHIAQFSDDSRIFNGAYGPRVRRRWNEVISLLTCDPDSRQAIIPIFGQAHSYHSKDVPCTLTLQLLARDGKLNTIVSMRSSDIWLGLPYDIFNFTMLQNIAAAQLHLEVGWFKMFLGSSHLYERDVDHAEQIVKSAANLTYSVRAPKLTCGPPEWVGDVLSGTHREVIVGDRLDWYIYARVLTAPTNVEALRLLKELECD